MTTTRSIACTACGADVPQGRLSCPACGELLASVSGSMRTMWAAPATDDRPMLDALLDDDPTDPVADPVVDAVDAIDDPVVDAPPAVSLETQLDRPSTTDASGTPLVLGLVEEPASTQQPSWPDPAPPAPSWPDPQSPTPSWPDPLPPAPPVATAPPPPGAYLPPRAVPPAPPVLGVAGAATIPAGPAAPARAWAGPSVGADTPDDEATPAADTAAARARADEMIGWVAIAGCALALLGFLIPWARTMIGSSGTGYLDQWGLAGPGHILFVLALGAIALGAAVPNRIPPPYRLGIPGVIVGAMLIGVAWPYVLGPLGALPGAFLSLAGALTLVGAAIACLVVDRHARRASAV